MTATKITPDRDPLKRFNIENEKDLIRKLSIIHVFGTWYSSENISMAIALRYPNTCSSIGANDVESIFRYLEANSGSPNNEYAEIKGLRARTKQVKDIPEVQDVLKEWHFDIEKAKRRKLWSLQCLQDGIQGP